MTIKSDGNGGSIWTAPGYNHVAPDMEEYFPDDIDDDLHERMFGYRPRHFRNKPHRELADAEWAAWEWNRLPERTRLIYALKRGYPFFWSPRAQFNEDDDGYPLFWSQPNDYDPEDLDYTGEPLAAIVAAALVVLAIVAVGILIRL